MKKYNHAFTVAFSINSDHPQGDDISADEFHQALVKRSQDLTRADEWLEAVGAPFDTYENEDFEVGIDEIINDYIRDDAAGSLFGDS